MVPSSFDPAKLRYVPFEERFLSDAAALLAARHQRDQATQPMLSARFTDPAVALQAIGAQWQRPWSSGVAAFDGDRMVGYLIGYMQVDQFFGRAIWSRLAGHAVAGDVDSDLYRDLYAAAAPTWLTWGSFEHLILVPAAPIYLEPWSLLSFGRMHAYGVMPMDEIDDSLSTVNPAVVVRQVSPTDADHLRAMAFLTAGHQLSSPTWALTPPEIMAARPDQYAGIVDDEEATSWLAFVTNGAGQEEAAGFQAWYPAELDADALDMPDQAIELSAAGVHARWRGRGVMRTLNAHALAHAKAAGYRYAITNWRTTNLLSSRTWPRMGFTPVMYRLHRHVDERILWAPQIG